MARHSDNSDLDGLRLGAERFHLFCLSAARTENYVAGVAGKVVGVHRCRCCAGWHWEFVAVLAHQQAVKRRSGNPDNTRIEV